MIIIFIVGALLLQTASYDARKHHRHHHRHHLHFSNLQQSSLDNYAVKRGSVAALPALNVIVTSKESGIEFKIGECKVKLAIVKDCKYTLTPSPDTCGGKLPLAGILNHFLPNNGLAQKSNTLILPEKFDLKSLEIDKCETTISFQASSREKLDLIPGKLSMESVQLGLKINYKTGAVDWELLELDMSGAVTIAGKKIPITVNKKTKEKFVTFSFKLGEINVPSIVGLFSKKEIAPPDADSNVAKKITGLVIKEVKVAGFYDPKGFYEAVFSGDPQGAPFKSSLFSVIIQKPEDNDVKAAVLAKIDQISPAKLLTDLTGKDLTKVPFIKELLLNLALAISNDDFVVIKNEELMKAISGFIKGDKTIEKGIKLYMEVPVREVFKKLAPDLKSDSFPASLSMTVAINKEGVKLKFPESLEADLLQILKGLAPKLKEYLPKWMQPSEGPPLIKIKDFSFDYKTMAFSIGAEIDGPFKLGNILTLYNISITISRKEEDSTFDFSFSSSQTLFKDIVLSTKLSKKGKTYEFEGTISMITTSQLVRALGAKFVSEDTLKKLSYFDFGMKDVKLKAKFGDEFYISLSGTAILFGWDGVKFEGLLYYDGDSPVMALGIIIEKIRMDEIVEKLFKKKLSGITWLTELNVVLTLSNTDATAKTKDLKFENENLQAVGIKKGVLFRAVAKIPSDCKGDKVCEMAKSATKDEKKERAFIFQGQITPDGVELRAIYEGQWQLGKNVKIPRVELVINIGKESKIYFAVTVDIKEPKLQLGGTIGIGGTGSLQLSARMSGLWEKAFGNKYIAFGNIAVEVGIIPGVALSELAFEGELQLGAPAETAAAKKQRRALGDKIISKAAIGIDATNPINTYFYAEISKFTLQAIVDAFALNVKLPKTLMQTGFPNGVIVSFTVSPKGKELKELKVTIQPGFHFQGKISILGFDVYLECTISHNPPSFHLIVELPAVKIGGGLIAVQKSKTEADKGPRLEADIKAAGVTIKINAFVTVLGISVGTVIDVSDNGLHFEVSGSLFGIVSAEVKLTSKYTDIKTASFHVSACIKTGSDDVQKEVKNNLEESGKEATKTMDEAKQKAAGIGDLYLKSKAGVTKMEKEVKEINDEMRDKGKDVDEAKKALLEECLDKCPKEYIGAPDWDPKCFEVDGGYIGCPIWNDKRFQFQDLECVAKCKGESSFAQFKAKVKQEALEVLIKILEGIKKLFHIGKEFFDKTKKLVDSAKELLSEASEKLKAGLEAAKTAATTAIESVVQIHSMCFESGLSEAAKACVGFKINATFFKTKRVEFDTQGCLDVSFAKTIAQAIADKLYPGLKVLKGAIGSLKAKFGLVDKEKDKVEDTVEQAKKVCKDGGSKCKRDVVWTDEEKYYRKLAYEQLPRFTLRDEATMRVFERDTPSQMAASEDPIVRANIEGPKRFMHAKKRESVSDNESPCQRFARRLGTAENITTGMKALVNSYINQKEKFKKSNHLRRNRINRLGVALRAKCLYYGCDTETLNDALFYARKAKKEILNWGKVVDTQIKRQDIEAFRTWKKELNFLMKATKGEGIVNYLKGFHASGRMVQARMGIPENDERVNSLREISKKFVNLMGNDVSLTKSIPAINELASDIARVKSLSTSCSEY